MAILRSRALPRARLLVRACAAPVLAAGLVAAAASPAAADGPLHELRRDLDALLEDPALEGAVSGVVVRSADTGEELYGREPDTALLPASNMKLLTSAAALEVFGPEHRFTTGVRADTAPNRGGVVRGDLYLVGGADPTLTADAYDDLAEEVADAGVRRVTGDLVADDTLFDDERLHPDWEAGDEPYYYAAQISALTVAANEDYDTGVVTASAEPGDAAGDPVEVGLEPMADNLEVRNEAATGAPDSAPSLQVTREPGTNTFTFSGSLPAGGDGYEALRTVDDPTAHAAHLFADALEDNGVKVTGGVGFGAAPAYTAEVADRASDELGDLLVPFMKLSNNGHAEMLVKAMGAERTDSGSWKAGTAVVEEAAEGLGLDTGRYDQADGSGLARTNTMTAHGVADLLDTARGEPWWPVYENALPLAGAEDRMVGGTLRNRMRDTAAEENVRAKTGTLTGVSALSGYVTAADGEELVFVVLNNGYSGSAPRHVQDAIGVRLAEFSREGAQRMADGPAPTSAPAALDAPAAIGAPAGGTSAPGTSSPGTPGTADLECTWAGTC
ncbi:D-alanyl-D-alanine carboxypeptidase/D-alanyl-D-alanine endopeptidase [Nocardiopsis chromatogenes]|uniref:D-alanyl-D-alanine carboxypeptidase/D-alanyl-D-alanine endopeptidase n=1 Tax=Nocardiopsis chromatogenes TaxID=280239 RepID=UPI000348F018|nr:D-alanyl-D-alanine carboxypeptidase/D-alanyl-D-alanine-endopeptidase [Nocardiopsis chromatogenes]